MGKGNSLTDRDWRRMMNVAEALSAQRDLRAAVHDAFPLLLSLVGADYAALATIPSESDGGFEWITYNLPDAFLGAYAEMAPHDFVYRAAQSNAGAIVRMDQIIRREALERNIMYQRARELNVPIEELMAVMLPVDGDLRSGLSLYRARRRPFEAREGTVLQGLTAVLTNAVRACWSNARIARRASFHATYARARVLVHASGREIERTVAAEALLDTWFTPGERAAGSLPRPLIEGLTMAKAAPRGSAAAWRGLKLKGTVADLHVTYHKLDNPTEEPRWLLSLREVPHYPTLPASIASRLTAREAVVAAGASHAWDNRQIAKLLGISAETVKQHLKSAFGKLDIEDRKQLMMRVQEAREDE